jgi:hypothetical protein
MTVFQGGMFNDLVPGQGREDFGIVPGSTLARYETNITTPQPYVGGGAIAPGSGGGGYGGDVAHVPTPVGTPTPVTPTPTPAPTPAPTPTPAPAPAPGTTPAAGGSTLDAWNQFYNSPAYQVPLSEGLKAVNTKYAAMGALESGAAMKAISDYGAGHAASALGTYMDDLYRQEALGASTASALAGVGQNLVGQVSANNNNAASAAGNAALIAGQGVANNWNAVGAGIGQVAGSVAGAMGSSYGSPAASQQTALLYDPSLNGGYG